MSVHTNESPRFLTYSISYCDNMTDNVPSNYLPATDDEVDDSMDVALLLPDEEIRNVNVAKKIMSGIKQGEQFNNYSRSCPIQVPQNSGIGKTGIVYGSLPSESTGLSPVQHVVYCIHGKPNGCCVLSDAELMERPSSASRGSSHRDTVTTTIVGEHCHQLRPSSVDVKARRKLIIASILCVFFMIGEGVGGYLSSSLAIATDAAHLLTDFASFMISLFALWMASRPPTRVMSFGWYRAEVLGALTSVLMIWVVTGVLVYLAVERVIHGNFKIDGTTMLITSGVGVLVNLVMGLVLHQHGHTHGGSAHSHQENINVRAAFIHVLGDFLQSFGVFLAALAIYFKPNWGLVDPICTFMFSVLVLITTYTIIKDTMLVLMEGLPKGIDFTGVMNTFMNIDGVVRVHNLRIWALSMDKTALAAHIAIAPGKSPQKVLQQASRDIRAYYNFFEMTLQIEEFDQNMEDCEQCKPPDH